MPRDLRAGDLEAVLDLASRVGLLAGPPPGTFENDERNEASGARLVLCVTGIERDHRGPQPLALPLVCGSSGHPAAKAAKLDLGCRLAAKVEVPGGVPIVAAVRGNKDKIIAIA